MTQIIVNILVTSALVLLIASSFSIHYFTTKFFNLAYGVIITGGAYFVYLFSNLMAIPLFFSIPMAILASILAGVFFETCIYRILRKKNLPSLSFLIASIGLYIVCQNLLSLFFGDDTKVIRTGNIATGHQILGAYITTTQIIIVVVSLLLVSALNFYLHSTSMGKSIRATAENSELSNIYGVNIDKIILIVTGIGAALAAVAGILSALDTNMTPTFGFNLLLYGIVAMIIGGVGSSWGTIAGTLLMISLQHLAGYFVSTKWMDAVTYAILILFLTWKPLGFSGKQLRKVQL